MKSYQVSDEWKNKRVKRESECYPYGELPVLQFPEIGRTVHTIILSGIRNVSLKQRKPF